jgi:hypothetical protein
MTIQECPPEGKRTMRTTMDELKAKVMRIFDDQRLEFVQRGAVEAEFQFALDASRHIEDTPCQDDSNLMEFIADERYWQRSDLR